MAFLCLWGFIITHLAKARGVNPPWSTARFTVPAPCLPVAGIVENYRLLLPGLPHGSWQGKGTNRWHGPVSTESSHRILWCVAWGDRAVPWGPECAQGALGSAGWALPLPAWRGGSMVTSSPRASPAALRLHPSASGRAQRGETASNTQEKSWWEVGSASRGYARPPFPACGWKSLGGQGSSSRREWGHRRSPAWSWDRKAAPATPWQSKRAQTDTAQAARPHPAETQGKQRKYHKIKQHHCPRHSQPSSPTPLGKGSSPLPFFRLPPLVLFLWESVRPSIYSTPSPPEYWVLAVPTRAIPSLL